MQQQASNGELVSRMIRAARLEVELYEEVEADQTATGQAATVVVLSSLAVGVGALLAGLFDDGLGKAVTALVLGVVGSLISWVVFAWLTYQIGERLFSTDETHVDWGQVARALGFGQSPSVLAVFAFVPVLGGLLMFVVAIWILVAAVIAIRQALELTTGRAIGTAIVGWLAFAIVRTLIFAIAGV